MKKCKQVHFVEGTDLRDLENKINEALRDGAELGGIDIASLTGAIIVTEYVGDIKKTLLDELEDELGRHECGECPFFKESTDKRKKWTICGKGKRVQRTSCCCTAYYETLREEVESEVSENQGENEGIRRESRGRSGVAESVPASRLRQTERSEQVPYIGTRVAFGVLQDTAGRVV